jgi:3-oxoadipate enol-lactonase
MTVERGTDTLQQMSEFAMPWLPAGHTAVLPGRGEVFYRYHRHPDPAAPTLMLLHGWTASADLQFFSAYAALAEVASFVAIDHRGHGRGLRRPERFDLDDVADDAAALLRHLDLGPVITVGYSMGGPVSMLVAHRHPELVSGVVVQATALEWRSTLWERVKWKTVRVLGPMLRSWAAPGSLRFGIRRLLGQHHPNAPYVAWLSEELRRNDTFAIVHAGQSLSRYDARPWASSLGIPAASLITTKDRLVRPRKQRALAQTLGGPTVEVADDHLCTWTSPHQYAAATVELVRLVAAATAPARSTPAGSMPTTSAGDGSVGDGSAGGVGTLAAQPLDVV